MSRSANAAGSITAIVPTIGRPDSLSRLLESLACQSMLPSEVVVADGSADAEVQRVVDVPNWSERGLRVRRIPVFPPNAVRQRRVAIEASCGEYLLLLDDDVKLEPACIEEMVKAMNAASDVVAVAADFNNQSWSGPTGLWRWYLRWCCGLRDGDWQGRVIGPLLRFGYSPPPPNPAPMEWLGAGMSLIKRSAYERVGGFSDFFLHRCTMNEDVDLGIKLCRTGRIVFCPTARVGHFHAPGGRVPPMQVAEDDMYNRFLVLHRTQGLPVARAFGLVLLYFTIETSSNLFGVLRRFQIGCFPASLAGRLRALARILFAGLFTS